jgi:hypothetical protein
MSGETFKSVAFRVAIVFFIYYREGVWRCQATVGAW